MYYRKPIFSSKRLKLARMFRGMTVDTLAKQININKKDILAFEDDKYKPLPENEEKLAKVLNFPKEYFFQKEDINVIVENTHIRPESKLPRIEDITHKEQLIMTNRVISMLEKDLNLPKLNLPNNLNRNDDIEILAQKVREYWNANTRDLNNMVSLLENNGIIISSINNSKKNALSFTQKQKMNENSRYLISLGNDEESNSLRNFDLAYELGYIVSTEANISAKKFSKDDFACAFLLPKEEFFNDLENVRTLEDYLPLKKKYNVPMFALIMRANQIGVLNYKKYMSLMNEVQRQGWISKDPLDKKAVKPSLLNNIKVTDDMINKLEDRGLCIYKPDVVSLLK